jgi:hypothetical protein
MFSTPLKHEKNNEQLFDHPMANSETRKRTCSIAAIGASTFALEQLLRVPYIDIKYKETNSCKYKCRTTKATMK